MILMPDTGAKTRLILPANMLGALMETEFRMKNGLGLKVGASVGLSTAPEDGTTVHSIIGAADLRMYMVKADGRGKVWSL